MDITKNRNILKEHVSSDLLDERRFKIISFHEQFLIQFFNWWRNPPHFFQLPITNELPEDCVVVAVSASFERRCIDAMVASSKFPSLQPGEAPERIPGILTEFRIMSFK